ncbi:MAG: histidinol dehydrogenase [Acidimicrobiales bacterium]|nr:histidinol dehydrogenase [Actinomycetota bacterium]
MIFTQLDLRGHVGDLDGVIPRARQASVDVREAVAEILSSVRDRGDEALVSLAERFQESVAHGFRVPVEEIDEAEAKLPEDLLDSLRVAFERILRFHLDDVPIEKSTYSSGVEVTRLVRPIQRVGCYAPGGLARYPSTVLMCAGPARAAGVDELVLCVPPEPGGHINTVTLAAASIAGISEVYAIGGAQAIAAMAFGTESIPRVDKVVGPGNLYVAEAQRQLSGLVGISSAFAGPSEVALVAGAKADPRLVAADLALQAEHGPSGAAWLVTWSEGLVGDVDGELARIVDASPRSNELLSTLETGGYSCLVSTPKDAIEVVNAIAPEHLELMTDDPEGLLPLVRNAGVIFLGEQSTASFGDYLAGPNHVLPTNRTARFASALGTADFLVQPHAIKVDSVGVKELGPHAIRIAEAEGLKGHADSIRIRL